MDFESLTKSLTTHFKDSNVEILPDEHLNQILLYGSNTYTILNKLIIEESIRYIHISGRFDKLEAFSMNS